MHTKEKRFETVKVLEFKNDYVVMLDHKGQKGRMAKEEFEKNYERTKGYNLYKVKQESEKLAKEKIEFFTNAFPHILAAQAKGDLKDIMSLGIITEEYTKKFNCSMAVCMKELKELQMSAQEKMIGDGVHFMKPHNVPNNMKKKNWENKKNIERENKSREKQDSSTKATMSIGDLLKAKEKTTDETKAN